VVQLIGIQMERADHAKKLGTQHISKSTKLKFTNHIANGLKKTKTKPMRILQSGWRQILKRSKRIQKAITQRIATPYLKSKKLLRLVSCMHLLGVKIIKKSALNTPSYGSKRTGQRWLRSGDDIRQKEGQSLVHHRLESLND